MYVPDTIMLLVTVNVVLPSYSTQLLAALDLLVDLHSPAVMFWHRSATDPVNCVQYTYPLIPSIIILVAYYTRNN